MAAEAQGRMQNAVEGMLETLEKEKIRPLLVCVNLIFLYFSSTYIKIRRYTIAI